MESGVYARLEALLIAAALAVVALPAAAADDPLERLIGTWDATVQTLAPTRARVTYTESYRWVLGRKFLEGRTSKRSDGIEEVVYATYDKQKKGYPFWIFSSNGNYVYLEPATWNAKTRVMEWKNPPGFDIWYHTRLTFADDRTRHWSLLVKDWKGTVLLKQEGRSVRRKK